MQNAQIETAVGLMELDLCAAQSDGDARRSPPERITEGEVKHPSGSPSANIFYPAEMAATAHMRSDYPVLRVFGAAA